jgi:hypothetical protein
MRDINLLRLSPTLGTIEIIHWSKQNFVGKKR